MTADTKLGKLSDIVKCMQKCLECTICLEILSVPVKTRCGHLFCYTCIMEVVKKPGASCPLCKISLMRRSISRDEHTETFIKKLDKLIQSIEQDTGININWHTKKPCHTKESTEPINNYVYPCTSFGCQLQIEDQRSIDKDCQSTRVEKLSSKVSKNSEERTRKHKSYNINSSGPGHVDVLETMNNTVIDDNSAMINTKIQTWLNNITVDDISSVSSLKKDELQELSSQTCSQIDLSNLKSISQSNADWNGIKICNDATSYCNRQPIILETLITENEKLDEDYITKNNILTADVAQKRCSSKELSVGKVEKMYKEQSNAAASQNIFEISDDNITNSTISNLKYKGVHARASMIDKKRVLSKGEETSSKLNVSIDTDKKSDNALGDQEQPESIRYPNLSTSSNSTKKTWSMVVQFGKEMRPKTRKLKSLNISIEKPFDAVHVDNSVNRSNDKRVTENDSSHVQSNKISQTEDNVKDNICALKKTSKTENSTSEINREGDLKDFKKDNATDIGGQVDVRKNTSDNDRKSESVVKSAISVITLQGGENTLIDHLNQKQLADVIGVYYNQDDHKDCKNENISLDNHLIDKSDSSINHSRDQYQDLSDKSKKSSTSLTTSPLTLNKNKLSVKINSNNNEENNESLISNDSLQRHTKLDSKQNIKENLVQNDHQELSSMPPKLSPQLTIKDHYFDNNERSANSNLDLRAVPSFTNQNKLSLRKNVSDSNINNSSYLSSFKQNLCAKLLQYQDNRESKVLEGIPRRHSVELGRKTRLSLTKNIMDEKCHPQSDKLKQPSVSKVKELSLIENHDKEKDVNNFSNTVNDDVNSGNLRSSISKNSTNRSTNVIFKKLGKIVKNRRKVIKFLYLGSTKPKKLENLENDSFQNQSIVHDRQIQTSPHAEKREHVSQSQSSDLVIPNSLKKSSKPSIISNVLIKKSNNVQLHNEINTHSSVSNQTRMQSKTDLTSNSFLDLKVSDKVNMLSPEKDSQLRLLLRSPLYENDSSERQKSQSLYTSHILANPQEKAEEHLPKIKNNHEVIEPISSNMNNNTCIFDTRKDEETSLVRNIHNDLNTRSTFDKMIAIEKQLSLVTSNQEVRKNNKNDYKDVYCTSEDEQAVEISKYKSEDVPLSQNQLNTLIVFRNKRRRLIFSSDETDDDDDVSISNKTEKNVNCFTSLRGNRIPSKRKTTTILQITEDSEKKQPLNSQDEKTSREQERNIFFQRENNNKKNITPSSAKESICDYDVTEDKNKDKGSSCDEESYSDIITKPKRKCILKDDEFDEESLSRKTSDSTQCSSKLKINSKLLERQVSPQNTISKLNTEDNVSTQQKRSFKRIMELSSPEDDPEILKISVPLKHKISDLSKVKKQCFSKTVTKDVIPKDNFNTVFSNISETQALKRKRLSSESSLNDDTDVREIVKHWCDELSSSQKNHLKDHTTPTISTVSKDTKINKSEENAKSLKVKVLNPNPFNSENQTSTNDDNFSALSHIAVHGSDNYNCVPEDENIISKRRKLCGIEEYSNSEKDHFCDDILEKFDQIRNHTNTTYMKNSLTTFAAHSSTSKEKENMIATSNNLLEDTSCSKNMKANFETLQFDAQLKKTNIEDKDIMSDNFDEVMSNLDTQLLIHGISKSEQSGLIQGTSESKRVEILNKGSKEKVMENCLSEKSNAIENNSLVNTSKLRSVIESSIINTPLKDKAEGFKECIQTTQHSDSSDKENNYLNENTGLLSNNQILDEVQSSQKKEDRKNRKLLKEVPSEDIPQAVNITSTNTKFDKISETFSDDLLMNITQEQLYLKNIEEDLFGAKKSSNVEENNKDVKSQQRVLETQTTGINVSNASHAINNYNEVVIEEVGVKNFKTSGIKDVNTTPESILKHYMNASSLLNSATCKNSPAWNITPIPKLCEKYSIATPSISSATEEKSKNQIEHARATAEGLKYSETSQNEKKMHSFYESTPKSSRVHGKTWFISSSRKDKPVWSNLSIPSIRSTSDNTQKNLQQQFYVKKLCFVCSGLSLNQIQYIKNFAKLFNAEFTNKFKPEVTHVIVKVYEEKKSTDKTLKYLQGIAHRKWIVGFNWAVKCMEQKKLLNEEEYEIVDETLEAGPKRSRLRQKGLFEGFVFLCMEPFIDILVEQYQDLLLNTGASVVQTLDELVTEKVKLKIIAIQADAHNSQTIVKWYERTKAIVIAHEWIVECISQYKLISLYPFLKELLPQDVLALGFPQELVDDDEECDIVYETSS